MTVVRENIKYVIRTIGIWTAINLFLNLIGLGTVRLLSEYSDYTNLNLLWHLKFIAFQALIFAGILTLVFLLTGKKRIALYSFTIFQSVIFHMIFFMDLEFNEGKYYFSASDQSWEYSYLFANGQNLLDIISVFDPLTGTFDCGMFIPESLFRFYSVWILLTILYFYIVTRWTENLLKRLESKSTGHNTRFGQWRGDM